MSTLVTVSPELNSVPTWPSCPTELSVMMVMFLPTLSSMVASRHKRLLKHLNKACMTEKLNFNF